MTKPITNPVHRFFLAGKIGWRPAINAMCAYCVGCSSELQGNKHKTHIEPGFKNLIKTCPSTNCPIHHIRPYQDKKDEEKTNG